MPFLAPVIKKSVGRAQSLTPPIYAFFGHIEHMKQYEGYPDLNTYGTDYWNNYNGRSFLFFIYIADVILPFVIGIIHRSNGLISSSSVRMRLEVLLLSLNNDRYR